MTLSERNAFFKAGIVSCAVFVILIIAISFFTMPLYINNSNQTFTENNEISLNEDDENNITSPLDDAARRPHNFLHKIANSIAGYNYLAVHISLFLLTAFSLTGMILIYNYFERTSTPEILYIAFFIVSCSFEVIRIIIPLHLAFRFPTIYIMTAMRILLFARFFGIFSLFTAGICSAGLEIQRIRNAILIITIAGMILTISIPIDVLSWDTSFNIVNGYNTMFKMIELVAFITIITSFLITAKNKDSKEYLYAAIGILIIFIGRNLLLNTDNWIGTILGIAMLSFGMWMLCSKLHKIHLWL